MRNNKPRANFLLGGEKLSVLPLNQEWNKSFHTSSVHMWNLTELLGSKKSTNRKERDQIKSVSQWYDPCLEDPKNPGDF